MESTQRHIIIGYAVFTLFFLGALFVFALLRIDMLSVENKKVVEFSLGAMKGDLLVKYGLKGSFDEKEVAALFTQTLAAEPRLLVIAVYSSDYGILKAVGKSKEYLVNAQFRDYSRSLQYQKPMGTSEINLPLSLSFKNSSLNVKLSALYISFSSKDSTTLLWEILYVLLGFFALTLIVIIITAVAFRRRAGFVFQEDLPGSSGGERAGSSPRQSSARAGEGAGPAPQEDQPEELESADEELPVSAEKREERYSALSGLVRSEYFKERLTEEIDRAASFDQDLALIMISIDKIAGSAFSLREDFTSVLHHFFPLHDLAFEYGKDVFAVVVPDENSDAVIKTAKLIYKELFERRVSISMGLSSRNGRLPGASVLIDEAAEALSQAKEEGHSPIIAFRPDPG